MKSPAWSRASKWKSLSWDFRETWMERKAQEQICIGHSQRWWRSLLICQYVYGMSGGPPLKHMLSCMKAEKKMKAHKKNVDAVAASLILEGYLVWRARNS